MGSDDEDGEDGGEAVAEPSEFEFPDGGPDHGTEAEAPDHGNGSATGVPSPSDGGEGPNDADGGEGAGDALDALELKYEEAKRVHEYQLDSIRDIDDKAAHTLRILVVLLGLLVTAVSIAARALVNEQGMGIADLAGFLNLFTVGGVVLLFCSLFAAIWTYNETSTEPGYGPGQLWSLRASSFSKRWLLQDLNDHFPGWIMHNEIKARKDATWLFVSHVLMFVALVALVFGVSAEAASVILRRATAVPVPIKESTVLIALGILVVLRGVWMLGRRLKREVVQAFEPIVMLWPRWPRWPMWIVIGSLLTVAGLLVRYPSALDPYLRTLGGIVSKIFIAGGP